MAYCTPKTKQTWKVWKMTKCLHNSIDWKSGMCRDCYEVFDDGET